MILDLRNKILGLLEQQSSLFDSQEGAAIAVSALMEVTLNLMLMHYGPSFTEKAVMTALREFLEKHREN
jgi:hypothetical protein